MVSTSTDYTLEQFLTDLYDLSTRQRGLADLHNRINKDLPNCNGKRMIIGKIRKHIAQTDEEIERTIEQMATLWNLKP